MVNFLWWCLFMSYGENQVHIVMRIAEQLNYLDGYSTADFGTLVFDLSELCNRVLQVSDNLSVDCIRPVFRKHYSDLKKVFEKGEMGQVKFEYNDGHISTANAVCVFVDFDDAIALPLKYGGGEKFIGEIKGECFFDCILDCNEIVDVFEDGDYVGTLDFDRL